MAKAYINGVEVKIYDFKGKSALCFFPDLDTKGWYNMNLIEVRYD